MRGRFFVRAQQAGSLCYSPSMMASLIDCIRLRRLIAVAVIRHGHSKDHRLELKQLLYILTVSNDGGVPVYFTTEDGDRNDDGTQIATWDLLRDLTGRADFLYVAD